MKGLTKPMSRREFVSFAAAGAAAAASAAQLRTGGSTVKDRPNILFCIADDQSWPHAGCYGDKVVKTPTYDRLAAEGVMFNNTHCCTPSCTPSRGSVLTGQTPHRLESGGNLWSQLPKKFEVYPDILEAAGYSVGYARKGWGPGTIEGAGRERNPAGPQENDFRKFLQSVSDDDAPFCYWWGSHEPHRAYKLGSGREAGLDMDAVVVPPPLPDAPEVRSDILDYYLEVQMYDSQVGDLLEALEAAGRAENTLVVMTSDNGMPFPRCKANLYEYGTHMPLVVRWLARAEGGRQADDFITFDDFAPTFLEAAGLEPLPEMTGRSFLDLLTGQTPSGPARDIVFLERERHASVREPNLSYPCRAIRTTEYLYIWNLTPNRWPAGDPERYGDIDGGPSKDYMMEHRDDPAVRPLFELAFGMRPEEELYDLRNDPGELTNVADDLRHADAKKSLRAELEKWMADTADPRATGGGDEFDTYPYFGGRGRRRPQAGQRK